MSHFAPRVCSRWPPSVIRIRKFCENLYIYDSLCKVVKSILIIIIVIYLILSSLDALYQNIKFD
jgi:hypothetical protein